MRQTPTCFGLAFALTMLIALATAPAAYAHAALLSTDPADGSVVATAPDTVDLLFNEPVSPVVVSLIEPDGTKVGLLDASRGGTTLVVTLPAPLPQGTHALSWRVVSTDGHPIGSSLLFSIGTVTGSAAEATATDAAMGVLLWAGKVLLFVALFAGIGGIAFGAVAPLPQPSRWASGGLAVIGLVAAPASLALQGLDALGLTLASVADGQSWAAGISTSYGATALAAMAAFAMALASLAIRPPRPSAVLGWAALAVGALAMAMSGHASTASPQWLARPAVFLHLAGIMFWVGALLPLWLLLRDRSPHSDLALARFSRFIPFAVAPIIGSGVILAFIQMGAPGPQWLAPYGIILGIKLELLALLFGLAVWNRRWLTGPALEGNGLARRRLRRSIRAEAIVVLLILGLAAGWRFTPPPRALADVPAGTAQITAHLHSAQAGALVMLTPGQTGPVELVLSLADAAGRALSPQGVSVTLAEPGIGIEPIRRTALRDAAGNWRVEGMTIPVAGRWTVNVEIRVSRFERFGLRGEVAIP